MMQHPLSDVSNSNESNLPVNHTAYAHAPLQDEQGSLNVVQSIETPESKIKLYQGIYIANYANFLL